MRNKAAGTRLAFIRLRSNRVVWSILISGLCGLGSISIGYADNAWFSQELHVDDGNSENRSIRYQPLLAAQEKWTICVALPQLTDSFWEGIAYGLTAEARRLGVHLRISEAGRYGGEQVQSKQISDCMADGGQALILSAVAEESLADLVATLADQDIPVVTLVGDIHSERVKTRLTGSFWRNGQALGHYLATRHQSTHTPVRVAWFPGPKSASWSRAGDRGFQDAIAGSNIELVAVRWGDVSREVQTRLLNEVLRAHEDLDYVIGNPVAAEIATVLLRKRKSQPITWDLASTVEFYVVASAQPPPTPR